MDSLLKLLVFRAYPALIPWFILPVSAGLKLGWVDIVFFPSLLIFVLCKSSRLNLVSISALFFLLFIFVSLFQIPEPTDRALSFLRAGRLAAIFAPIFLASSLRVTQRDFAVFLKILFFSVAGSIAFGLLMHFMGWRFVEPDQKILVGGEIVGRVAGLFGNTGTFGHMIALFLSLGIFGAYAWCPPRLRLPVQLFAGILGGIGLIYASSRGGTFNFLVFAGIYFFLSRGSVHGLKRIYQGAAALILFLGIFFALDFGLPEFSGDTMLSSSLEKFFPSEDKGMERFSGGRLDKWSELIRSSGDRFFTGIGYKYSWKHLGDPTDNFFLTTFVEMGIMGTISYCLFVLAVIYSISRRYSLDRRLGALGLALFLATVIHGMTTDIWTHWASAPLVTAAIGVIYARQRSLSQELSEGAQATRNRDRPLAPDSAPGTSAFGVRPVRSD